jgi:CHASE2 domain-containing sensor protein
MRNAFYNNVLIVLFTFLFLWTLTFINLDFDIFNPLSNMFKDFDLTDVVFSRMSEDPVEDKNIVMVNLSEPPYVDRAELAQMIEILNQHKPKIIAIDGFFRKLRMPDDSSKTLATEDSMLSEAFSKVENLVLGTKLNYSDKKKQFDSLETSNPLFCKNAKFGFVNLTTTGIGNMTEFLTCRSFLPQAKCREKIEYSFGVKIAEIFNPKMVKKFLERKNIQEDINYRGNIGFGESESPIYTALDYRQVLGDEFEPNVVKGKIIIIGFMGKELGEKAFDDKFYTPMNKNYVGKSTPDMYGVVVHANIVSMILKGDYINELNYWANFAIMIFASLLSVSLFAYFHQHLGYWYDAVTIVFQLIISAFLFMATVFAFHWYRLKIDTSIAIGLVVLSGIMVEIYYGLIQKIVLRFFRKKSIISKTSPEVKVQ